MTDRLPKAREVPDTKSPKEGGLSPNVFPLGVRHSAHSKKADCSLDSESRRIYGPKKELNSWKDWVLIFTASSAQWPLLGSCPWGDLIWVKHYLLPRTDQTRLCTFIPLRCCVVEMEGGMEASSTVPGTGLAPVVAVTMIKPSASLQCHLGLNYSRKKEIIFC